MVLFVVLLVIVVVCMVSLWLWWCELKGCLDGWLFDVYLVL